MRGEKSGEANRSYTKMQPNYNTAAERVVLSTFIFSPAKLSQHKHELTVDTFFYEQHKHIYDVLLYLDGHDRLAIDEDFIKRELEKRGQWNDNTLLDILAANPPHYISGYIKELQDLHRNRIVQDGILRFQNGDIDALKLNSIIVASQNLYAAEEARSTTDHEYKHLSPFMRELLTDLKSINDYPDSMVWAVMLPSMAGLIGGRARITNGINITVFPVIWTMIVAPSSLAAKSTLYRKAKSCIFGDMPKRLYDEFKHGQELYREQLKEFKYLPRDDKQYKDEPEPPMLKRVVFQNDGTPEAKIKSLFHNQNGGVVYYDEMKAELERSNADQGYKALKTSIFDGETYDKELVNGGVMILERPVLSEVGLITKNWLLDAVHHNDIASGFMARYLFSVNSRQDFRPLQIDEGGSINTAKYSKVGEFIMNMFGMDRDDPALFRLSHAARQKHKQWFNEYSKTVYETETDEEATASYRLSTYVLKFMLISYIFNNAQKLIDIVESGLFEIGVEYFDEAIEIMELFRNESNKLLQLFESSNKLNFKLDDDAAKVYKKIERAEGRKITRSEAQNIRGVNKQKLDYMIENGMLISQKDGRTEYLTKP